MSIHDQVTEALGAEADAFDISAITEALRGKGITDDDLIDTIPTDEFWDLVQAHPAPDPGPTEAEQFKTDLGRTMAGTPAGEPAVWTDGTVTVAVRGHSRVRRDWPHNLADVVITTPAGEHDYTSGANIASWGDLWQRVEDARDTWEGESDRVLAGIERRHRELTAAEAAAARARFARDQMIRTAVTSGVTAYRIAKRLGVAESTIGRIVK